ncbi:MAG: hypothetical protein K2M37_01355 [Muribaculaceae bacterium]|nr:hypothetical protein [Muribaculaceae bacterium]
MKNKIFILMLGGMMAVASTASAQHTTSGYFLDNYNFRYQMNPAFGNKHSFATAAIGNINVAMRGTLHVSDLIYVRDGKTVLFTDPSVSSSFLNDMSSRPRLEANLNINLLSGGFNAWGGYNTVSINARADIHAAVPKSLIRMMKEGITNKEYSFSDLAVSGQGFGEIAFNHSRDIPQVPGLRAGATVKFLLGVANFQAEAPETKVNLGVDNWTATTRADIYANLGGLRYKTDINDEGNPYVSGVDMNGSGSVGVNGFGMAFDLGASYDWNDFNFSLAFNDIGWISYFNTKKASTNGSHSISSNDYIFNVSDDKDVPHNAEAEWDRLTDDLSKLYDLQDNGDVGTRSVAMGTTMNVGIDYKLPYYRRLHFGLLSSTRFQGDFTWSEVRISANVNPVDCFSASVNGVFGSFGAGFGWLLNYYARGVTVFLGMDNTLGTLTKQGIPLNSNASVNFGISAVF